MGSLAASLRGASIAMASQPLGQGGTRGSQRTREVQDRGSQAYLMRPMDGLHKCCD